MPEDIKYSISLPDGRQTEWDQKQYKKAANSLYEKYPDADVKRYSAYTGEGELSPDSSYHITLRDGRETDWDAEQFSKAGASLMEKYPDAKISIVDDLTARRNRDFVHQYEYAQSKVADPSLTTAEKKQYEDFVGTHSDRYEGMKDRYGDSGEKDSFLKGEDTEPVTGYFARLKQNTKRMWGDILYGVGELMDINSRSYTGPSKVDTGLAKEALSLLEDREKKGEKSLQLEELLKGDTSKMSPEEKEEYNHAIDVERYLALRAGASKNTGSAKDLLTREVYGDVRAKEIKEKGAKIQDENSQEGKGIAAKAADLTYLAGSGLAAIGATALGQPEIGAAIGNAAFASFAASSAGSSMRAARDAGATDEETVAAGTASAAIMYLVGRIPFLKNMKIASRATSTKAAQAMTEALSNPAVKESVMKEAGKLTKEAAEALGMTTSHYIKQILGQTASSSATFAAMNGMEALVPLIYANPEEYPVLNQVTKSVAEGAIDGAIMGALFGGVSSGSEYIARRNHIRSQMAKNGGVVAAAMDLSKGEARVWNEKTGQFEQVETPPEAGWGEILGVQKGQAQEGEAPEWVHVLFNGKYYTVKSDAIARETVTLFTPKDLDKASRDAFTSEGETRGREADTPLLRGAIRQEKDYLDRKAQYEESNGGVTETTQLDIDRNNAALEGRRDATLSEIVNKVGRQQFWKAKSGPDNSVINTVDVVTFEDGSQGYVVSEDEFGLAVVSEKGKNIISKDDPQITNRQTYDLNEYLDSVVAGQDSAAETERMSSAQADNLAAVQERLVQEGKINVGTEEAPVIGTLVDADITPTGGAYLQVEGEKETRFVPWKEVASSLGMSLDAKTDAQIADDRLSGEVKAREYNKLIPMGTEFQAVLVEGEEPVTYQFKRAFINEDGTMMLQVTDKETGKDEQITEEMALQGNLTSVLDSLKTPEEIQTEEVQTEEEAPQEEDNTLRDFRGNPIPLKDDGSVNQTALWNADPEAWARWNDSQRNDGGANSRGYIAKATKKLQSDAKAVQKQIDSELDFDRISELEGQLGQINSRIADLERIENNYANAEVAQTEAVETPAEVPAPVAETTEAAPVAEATPEVQEEAVPQTPEQVLDSRLAEAKTPEEKRQALEEYYALTTTDPTVVGTRADMLQRMAELGFSERVIGQVRDQLNAEGTLTEGFHIGDMVFIVADDIRDARRARLAHLHEHWHEVNRQKGYQKVVASIPGATTEYLLAAANKMAGVSDKNGYGDYLDYPNPQQALADEVIALSMEVVAESTPENVDDNLRNAGLDNQEIINFVKTIYNGERGNDQTLDSSGRDTLSGDNAQEGERQDGGDSASQPEGNLGEQGSGSGEGSIQGAGEGGLDTSGNPEVTPTLSPAQQEKGTNFVIEDGKLTSYMDAPTGQKSPSAPDETMFSLKREEDSKDDEGKTVPGLRTLADGFLAKLADKPLTPEELAIGSDAIKEMVDYMMPYLDKVKDGKRYLPEEIFGKGWSTIFKNGSYGRTMENTLICMRTLAYNDFVNAVQEKVGRPLTPTESFLASQMLYDIATDPQCLYCYVALDRKAYNGFLKTYIEQRDAVLDKYKADDSIDKTYRLPAQAKSRKNRKALSADNQVNKLYLEYLDGRADTPSMRNRFNGWLDRIAEGTLIGMKDLTSPETRQKVAGKGASYAAQIDDAEKYAQSASWAKKQEEYRAYNGELLSMPQKVVDLLNSEYGLRFYSFSEYSPAFIVENMQMVRDAALRGLVGLAYTKEIDFAKIFAPTGININISCYGREAEDGTVVMDTKQGADWGEAQALRERYGNVGCVFVATNDRMVEWAIHQPWVDVVIPFHIVRTGEDIAKFYDWTNYTAMEADKDVKGRSRDIMPTEHMNDKDTFLRLCEERGLKPRFADLILPSTGRSVTEDPDYMKLVNETRRSVNETVRIKPVFDTQEARRSFDEFVEKGGYYAGWFTEEGAFERGVEQVAADVEAGKTAKDVDYGRQDIKASAEKLAAMAGKKKRPRTHQGTPRRIGGDKMTQAQQNVLNYLETGEFKSEREPLEVANATQKQPASEATEPVVTEEDVMFRLSKNNKATVESWLKKREDLNDEQRAEVVDYIDKLDDAKTQLATAKWFANGTIRIPEDMKKVQQAISVAGKAKVDPLRYNSPMELLDAHAEFKPSEERINPDEVSTLHRSAAYPDSGIVVYDVDSSEESRKNMREIINTHFGKDASPWCLLQGDGKGNLTPDSAKYWRHYNAYPKQVAFKDGKLLAFSANDRATRLWWDRKDESHYGIPITQKVEGDELGRSAYYIIENGELVKEPGTHLFRGNKQNGVYEEWSTDGSTLLERTNYKNGEKDGLTEAWYLNGQIMKRASMKNDNYVGRYEAWFDNGNKQADMIFTEEGFNDGERKTWWKNGQPRYDGRYKNGKRVGEHRQWDEEEGLESVQYYDEDGEYLGYEEHGQWGLERKVTFLDDGGQEAQKFTRGGRILSVERTNGKGRLNGLQELNFIDGTPNVRANYSDGVLDGLRVVYRPNGKLMNRGEYKNGSREGIHELYDKYGDLISRQEYHNDEKVRELPLDENVQFRKAFDSVENELGEEQVSVDNPDLMNEYGLSNVTMTKKGDVVTLNKVVVTDQKKGNGTRFMQDFTQKADKEGWTLALTPDDSFGATSISRLKKFYKRFGFKENKGKNADLTINESMIRKPEEDVRFRKVEPIVDEKNEELFEQAKKTFGVTKNLSEAGYVIPDGSMLDFSGRHLVDPNKDSSWLNGGRTVNHRDISDLNYEKDLNTPSGYETDMSDFIRRGAIRLNSGVINLATKPTSGQENVLWTLIQRANGDVDVDFGDGYDSDHYASYNHARPERILNDIRRYFDEGIEPEGNVMFRKANQTQNGFISNAQMALDKIKMDKATPEQWLKMLEKEGGLKAGEDKWLGLSDWLKESDKKTLTKDEIGDFVEQNRIQIEEVHYSEAAIEEQNNDAEKALERYRDEYEGFASEWRNGEVENSYNWPSADDYAFDQMVEKYGEDFRDGFEIGAMGQLEPIEGYDDDYSDAAKYFLGIEDSTDERPINSVRLDYTTPELSNKREIALTVPTIDPWNESDKIHFGDAGEGRAVAWIRFGDAWQEGELMTEAEKEGLPERYRGQDLRWKPKRVLVIDEIQSKRHQEGRESGYADATKIEALEQKMKEASQASVAYIETLKEKYDDLGWIDEMTDEEERRVRELDAARITTAEAFDKAKRGVPAAPFEKNWHELAMKRMLRLAAEEGYDKIAWTTGDQQAERYNLGGVVNKIESTPYKSEGYNVDIVLNKGDVLLFNTDKEGTILSDNSREDQYVGKNLSDIVGKDIAKRILDSTEEQTISGDGLRVGGEGMNGFYDDILPRFMNKYGKKWGVKVQDVALSDVYDETGRPLVMHSVDVTPEMKESVMEGQTMFRKSQITPEQDKEYMDAVNAGDMEKAQQIVSQAAKVVKTAEKAGEKSYENSAGEVEARNAERRSRMSEEDRRRFSPEITEEVSRNEQEVRFRRSQELVSQAREGGLAGVIGDEDAAELYRNVYRAIPKEIRERIVDRAGDGFLFSEATQNAIAEAVEKGDETGIAGLAANMLRDYVGDLDERTARYILWRGDRKVEDDDLLDTVNDIALQRRLQVGEFADQPMFRKSPIAPEQDREYLDAVESGDMDKAQQMVKEAAALAMPDSVVLDKDNLPKKVLHGTNSDFNVFDEQKIGTGTDAGWLGRGFYFYGNAPEYASQYGKRIIGAYLNIENPYFASDDDMNRLAEANSPEASAEFRQELEDEGYDGVFYNGNLNEEWVAFYPNQIKSAEPVTYDDNGNVIPLSERFNPDSEDIRFRLADNIEENQNRADSMADDAKAALDEKKEQARKDNALTTIKAMSLQKEYDKKTVNTITVLAKNVLKDQSIETLSRHEIARLLGIITTSIGKAPKTVKKNADALVGLIVDHLMKSEETKLGMLANRKATKTNQAGVEVQGELDVRGQNILRAYKAGLDMDIENPDDEFDGNTIKGRLSTLSERLSSTDDAVRSEAEDEYAGLMLAQEYQENIKASINEERGLKNEMKEAAEAYRDGNISRTGYNQFVEEAEKSLRENKIDRIEAYRNLRAKMLDMMAGSVDARKEFTEREKQRVEEIHHLANSDMQGKSASPFQESTRMGRLANSSIVRFFAKPLATFDQMLRLFGEKNVAGEGYLFNKFHRGWLDAQENAYLGEKQAKEELDAKVSEVFDKKMRWSDLYEEERKMPTVKVKWWDGGEMKEHDLTQGNLLYIYMVNKMTDGRMKLRRMGITDEHVDAIKKQMDERFIELADWLQSEYLVNKRNKYNAVHERLFGASMAAIEDYFPLKINKRSLNRAEDIGRPEFDDALPATTTGSIIKRRRNAQDLDLLGADAFSVVIEHVEQMEQWAAFAEFNKDLNTLLSYKRFRNQVQNMATVYGSGSELWRNFKAVCRVAGGTYNPAGKKSDLDTAALNIAKGVTAAKISFRVYTALKQFLSMPAFVSDANIKYLGENMATPWKAWNWAMENLPLFEKRWKSRQAGDTRLMSTESDWKLWRNKIVEKASQWGMSPNAFVDALTVSIGAHSIYQSRYDRYIKDGYTEEQADKKAKQDATTLYNETQQSNEAAFTSPVQLDRTVLATMLTVFRNSSMGYQRQLHDAIRNIGKMMKPGYKASSIEFMKKQMVRDGLTEEQAEHAANRNYNREIWRSAARIGTFGFLVQFAWTLGGSIAYLLFGDDDDKKDEMLTEALIHGLIGGTIEGLAGGNVMSEALNMVAKGESLNNYDPSLLPIISDMKSAYKKMSYDPVAGANDLFNLAVQAGLGVNPQTLTDAVVAVVDACGGDLETSTEAMLLIMRVLQVPQSQVDQIYIDELGVNADKARTMSAGEMAERYAKYKVAKGAPLTGWAYSDEAEEKREKAYLKRFKKLVKERKESK